MAKFNKGFENIKVTLIDCAADVLAKKVYEFGRLSHDFYEVLPEKYNEYDERCVKLLDKIIGGTTLPKFALQGTRLTFRIENISRICLAQLTRDQAIFASQGGGVFPLTQEFNIPLSLYNDKSIMEKVQKAQEILEDAYIEAIEKDIPALEARYIGLHSQTISLTASYTPSDFVRSCYSRTSSNFCDECNLVYRLMYRELMNTYAELYDVNSMKLFRWLYPEEKCINDKMYTRERLYNSDFTLEENYVPALHALNDWRKSGWKLELERMLENGTGYLTQRERFLIEKWKDMENSGIELPSTYDNTQPDVAVNAIKNNDYYKEKKCEKK